MEFETKSDGTPFVSTDYSERHAEVLANRYDDGLGDLKIASFLRLVGSLAGLRLLDLGSGEGTFSRIAREQGAHVTAVDFAESMVVATARRANVPVVRASASALPFDENAFDLVLALDVIEHLYEPIVALDEIHRVLARGGRLVLATDREGLTLGYLPMRLPKPIRRVLFRAPLGGTAANRERYRTPLCTHTHEFPLPELVELVSGHGFVKDGLDTYPHRAELDYWGRAVEVLARGPLRRWKWNYVMTSMRAR